MYRAYAVRVAGATLLFNEGGAFDKSFAFGTAGFNIYASHLYHDTSGHFQANFFPDYFIKQGLINSSFGPSLPHFPFYEDVTPIHATIKNFMQTFISVYYTCDEDIASDPELQAWVVEANGPAAIYDFPPILNSRETLVDILTQVAYLAGIMHHALNTNALAHSWTLPLHPTSHYAPLPTEKVVKDIMPFLPDLNQSIAQIVVETEFRYPSTPFLPLLLPLPSPHLISTLPLPLPFPLFSF